MEEFRTIYRILKILRDGMDYEHVSPEVISAERLSITVPKWSRLIAMLVHENYITGIEVWNSFDCAYPRVKVIRPEITLEGLEYLEENSLMKQASKLAKGIKEAIPGM